MGDRGGKSGADRDQEQRGRNRRKEQDEALPALSERGGLDPSEQTERSSTGNVGERPVERHDRTLDRELTEPAEATHTR